MFCLGCLFGVKLKNWDKIDCVQKVDRENSDCNNILFQLAAKIVLSNNVIHVIFILFFISNIFKINNI